MGKVYKMHKIHVKNVDFALEENSKPENILCKGVMISPYQLP